MPYIIRYLICHDPGRKLISHLFSIHEFDAVDGTYTLSVLIFFVKNLAYPMLRLSITGLSIEFLRDCYLIGLQRNKEEENFDSQFKKEEEL